MNRLHLNEKDFWRYPLDRELLQPLLKDGTQTVQYQKDTKIWKLNGVALQLKNKETYSKIAGFVLYFFHQVQMYFSPLYRKKFQAAKLKIENALIEPPKKEPIPPPKPKVTLSKATLTEEKYLQLEEFFSQLEEDLRSNDFRFAKEHWYSKIGEVIGKDQLEKRIEELRPIFRQRERSKEIKVPPFVL